jgi:hypothetical protein
MKRVLSGVIAAMFAATVGLAAQDAQAPSAPAAPPAPSTQAPESPSPTGTSGRDQTRSPGSLSQAAGSVTISGCIQNAPPTATASATAGGAGDKPAAGASASVGTSGSQRFVLANAKPAAGASAGAVGTSGSSSRYELDGQSAELTKHLNHQVEITGTVSPAPAAGAASPSASASTASPKLMVTSVKMVSATCEK